MVQNLLALAVRPLDVATPILQARQIQKAETETAKNDFDLRQNAMGSEFRGLAPFVNHPEFGQRWTEAMDRMAQRGILDPQRHAQLRNSPSPLLLQQGLAMTSSGDQFLKMQQMQRTQAADATLGPQLYGGSPAPQTAPTGSPVAPAASMLTAQPSPSDPTMGVSPRQVAEVNGQPPTFNDRFAAATPQTPGATPVQTLPQAAAPVAPRAAPTGGISANSPDEFVSEVNRLTRIAANPDVSERIAKTAELRLKTLLEQSNDWKNYQRARASGDPAATKPFTEWLLDVKRAGATSISTTEGADAAAKKARLSIDVEGAKETQKQALAGIRLLPVLNEVERLATRTPGGWAGPVSATAARALSGLGLPVDEKYSNAEVLQSITQRLVPIVREPGPTSEKELDLYMRAVPGLMQSQDGRLKVVSITRAMVERSRQIAKVYRDHLGKPDLMERLAALDKPIIPDKDRSEIERAASAPQQDPMEGRRASDGKRTLIRQNGIWVDEKTGKPYE